MFHLIFAKVAYPSSEIEKRVEATKSMLWSMSDGEISISAYDTAWVALVEDVGGSGKPQFPEALQWIADNQLPDGSWGDDLIFSSHDRIINTLACVVALKYWKIHPDKCEKGVHNNILFWAFLSHLELTEINVLFFLILGYILTFFFFFGDFNRNVILQRQHI